MSDSCDINMANKSSSNKKNEHKNKALSSEYYYTAIKTWLLVENLFWQSDLWSCTLGRGHGSLAIKTCVSTLAMQYQIKEYDMIAYK